MNRNILFLLKIFRRNIETLTVIIAHNSLQFFLNHWSLLEYHDEYLLVFIISVTNNSFSVWQYKIVVVNKYLTSGSTQDHSSEFCYIFHSNYTSNISDRGLKEILLKTSTCRSCWFFIGFYSTRWHTKTRHTFLTDYFFGDIKNLCFHGNFLKLLDTIIDCFQLIFDEPILLVGILLNFTHDKWSFVSLHYL